MTMLSLESRHQALNMSIRKLPNEPLGGGDIDNFDTRFLHHFLRFILLDMQQLFGIPVTIIRICNLLLWQYCLPQHVESHYSVLRSMTETPGSFS